MNQTVPPGVEIAPVAQVRNALPHEQFDALLDYAISQQPRYQRARVSGAEADYRETHILFDLGAPGRDLEARLRKMLPAVAGRLKTPYHDQARFEMHLLAYTDGCYFRKHNDNGAPDTTDRFLTAVYYFWREPRRFSGGTLRVWDSVVRDNVWTAADSYRDINPPNNTLVVFPSRLMHEVLPTRLDGDDFADSRFAITAFLRRPATQDTTAEDPVLARLDALEQTLTGRLDDLDRRLARLESRFDPISGK